MRFAIAIRTFAGIASGSRGVEPGNLGHEERIAVGSCVNPPNERSREPATV